GFLVGDQPYLDAGAGEALQHAAHAGIDTAVFATALCIVELEAGPQRGRTRVDLVVRHTGGAQRFGQRRTRAVTDPATRLLERCGAQAGALQREVERGRDVGRGVDQGAVEVEQNRLHEQLLVESIYADASAASSRCCTACTTASAVKPRCAISCGPGADSPKRARP